jgi:parallel beta-helix repeat protein
MRIPKTLWLSFLGALVLNLAFLSFGAKAPNSRGNGAGAVQGAPSSGSPAEGLVFYVSTGSNDSWSGRLPEPNAPRTDRPFATLTKARDALRKLKARGPLSEPVTVYVRGGMYFLNEPILFVPGDSGAQQHPITYSAYPGETPVLTGGRRISGWKRGPRVAGDTGGLWTAAIPGVKEGKWYFHQLFVDGKRRQRARTPNEGFFTVDGEITLEKPARFKFRQKDINTAWATPGDVEVVALQAWAEVRMQVRAVDEASRTVTLSGQCAPSNREKSARYWVENAREGLDAPGEWYLDRRTGVLYYRPMPGEDMARAEVFAPVAQQLVRFEGNVAGEKFVENICLQGLTFSHTDWSLADTGYTDMQAAYDIPAVVSAVAARSCSMERCVFKHLGQYAVSLGKGSKNNRILGNEMTDLGAGGVKIGEPELPANAAQAVSGNVVSNNHIYDLGIVYPAAVGVWVGQSSGNTISHNHIHDTFYTGISVGWTWGYGSTAARENVIEFNHVHHIGRGVLSDMGGIYTLGMQPGTVIRNNLFHDIASYGYGGWGIYTDEGSSNILIENNVVYRTKSGGFHQHYGRENIIRNNIFALAREGQIIRSRQEPHLSFTFERNIVYWTEGPLLGGRWSDDQYRLDSNLYFQARGEPVRFGDWSFEEWQKRGQDVHSKIADPRFVDPENGDFTLQPASPAIQVGFQPLDLSKIGPQ